MKSTGWWNGNCFRSTFSPELVYCHLNYMIDHCIISGIKFFIPSSLPPFLPTKPKLSLPPSPSLTDTSCLPQQDGVLVRVEKNINFYIPHPQELLLCQQLRLERAKVHSGTIIFISGEMPSIAMAFNPNQRTMPGGRVQQETMHTTSFEDSMHVQWSIHPAHSKIYTKDTCSRKRRHSSMQYNYQYIPYIHNT